MTTEHLCTNYLCENRAEAPARLCHPCRISEELLCSVNDALEKFLNELLPWNDLPPRRNPDRGSPIYDSKSAPREEIFEASADTADGIMRLIELPSVGGEQGP
jgi:hypothetical protein